MDKSTFDLTPHLSHNHQDSKTDDIKKRSKRLYEVNWWLKSVPQGYLANTEYGVETSFPENPIVLEDPDLLEISVDQTCHLAYVEWITLDTVSGLIPICPDRRQKTFLATQVLDEARHIEIYEHRLYEYGVKPEDKDSVIKSRVNKNLVEFWGVMNQLVDNKDYVGTIFCQHVVLEAVGFSVFDITRLPGRALDPRISRLIDYVMIDESRHIGFGEHQMKHLIKENAHRIPELEKLAAEVNHFVVDYFAGWIRKQWRLMKKVREYPEIAAQWSYKGKNITAVDDEEVAEIVTGHITDDLKKRMGRIGLALAA